MTVEQVEQLGLQRGAGTIGVEIGEERILGVFEHERSRRAGSPAARPAPFCPRRSVLRPRCSGTARRPDDIIATRDAFDDRAACSQLGPRCGMRAALLPAVLRQPLAPCRPPSFEQKIVVDSPARGSARSCAIRRRRRRRLRRRAGAPAARGRTPVAWRHRRHRRRRPDLIRLLTDSEARVRRRAALAVGRVGLVEGVEPLVRVLADPDPEVRQMAAFALGLIGDRSARDPLIARAGRSVAAREGQRRGSARTDWRSGGGASRLAAWSPRSSSPAPSPAPPDETLECARDTPAAAFRLGVYALVRLKAYDALAAVVLDAVGPAARALVAGGVRAAAARGSARAAGAARAA